MKVPDKEAIDFFLVKSVAAFLMHVMLDQSQLTYQCLCTGVTFEMTSTVRIQNVGYNIHFYGDIQRSFGCPVR